MEPLNMSQSILFKNANDALGALLALDSLSEKDELHLHKLKQGSSMYKKTKRSLKDTESEFQKYLGILLELLEIDEHNFWLAIGQNVIFNYGFFRPRICRYEGLAERIRKLVLIRLSPKQVMIPDCDGTTLTEIEWKVRRATCIPLSFETTNSLEKDYKKFRLGGQGR